MKIKFLIAAIICFVSATVAFAQPRDVTNAHESYGQFTVFKQQKITAIKATEAINSAKESIDKAFSNPKAATYPLSYAVKGEVYASLALRDSVAGTSIPLFATAEEALKKAREMDAKGENKRMIDDAYMELVRYKYAAGVKAYQGAKYDQAYDAFNFYRTVRPDDTTAIYLTGLAAAAGQKYDNAIVNYTKLLTTPYSKNADVYSDLSYIYLQKKDTVNAIKTVSEGSAKFPDNTKLSKREIELNLQAGNQAKVLDKIEKAITNDPKNKSLYYYAGLTYTQAKDIAKAEAMYRKAVEIDPNYFDANLNLGYILLNPGITLFNAANKLPTNKQKEYDDDMAKATKFFEIAKPVLLKTVELNPNSVDALTNLKTYYLGTKNTAEATAVQKKITALKQ
jgi:tetratricopeptide (TPR) repeat protein